MTGTVAGRLRPLLLLLLTLCAIAPPHAGPALAQPRPVFDVLLDNSGSMRGFATEDTVWRRLLTGLEAESGGTAWYFDAGLQRAGRGLTDTPLDGRITDLGTALMAWVAASPPGAAAVIVTDNVADLSTARSAEAQRTWEALLQSDEFLHVELVPIRLPFNGRLFSPVDPALSRPYRGPRALAIYLLVRSGAGPEATAATVRHLQATVERQLVQAGITSLRLPITPFDIRGDADQVSLDVAHSDGATVVLEGDRVVIRDFGVGQAIAFAFDATIRPAPSFVLRGANIDARITTRRHEALVNSGVFTADVSPARDDLTPEGKRFRIQFAVRPFHIVDLPFLSQLDLALSNETTVEGELRISFQVQREQVLLAGPVIQDWSFDGAAAELLTADSAIQSRLFRLGGLVQGAIPQRALGQDALVMPVIMHVRYPLRAVIIAVLLGAAIVGFLAWLALSVARPRTLLAIDDVGGEHPVSPSMTSCAFMTSSDGRCEVSLRWVMAGLLVGSTGRLRSSRLLSLGGGTVVVEVPSEEGGGEHDIYRFDLRPWEQAEENHEETE